MAYLTDIKDNVRNIHEKLLTYDLGMFGLTPKLLVLHVGYQDDPSERYIRSKMEAGKRCGIDVVVKRIDPQLATTDYLIAEIKSAVHSQQRYDGIILQLPVPDTVNLKKVYQVLPVDMDVDGVTPEALGRLAKGYPKFIPCTPKGILTILRDHKIEIAGKRVAVIGRSEIVGKPMAMVFTNENATVSLCHSKTENLASITKEADIIVCAVGRMGFLTADLVKDGAFVVDVGINLTMDGKLRGDVAEAVAEKATVTPVPGGVGLTTVLSLMQNTALACFRTYRPEYLKDRYL